VKKFTVGWRGLAYRRAMTLRRLLLAGLLVLAGLPVADADAAKRRVGLKAFSSCAGLREYALGHAPSPAPRPAPLPPRAVPMPMPMPMPVSGGGDEGASAPAPAPVSAPAPQTGGGQEDSSTTNVQEAGIDEPDIVKTDGSYVYAVAGGRLHAVDARTATPRLLDSLDVPGIGGAAQLLHHGNRVLLIAPDGADTRMTEVDVSDPAALRIVHTLAASGAFVSARQHGQTARVVLSWTPPAVRAVGGPVVVARAAARRPSSGKGWVPAATLRTKRTGRTRRRALVSCRSVRHAARFAGLEMLTVVTIDLAKGLPAIDSDAVLASGENVYASATSLYVATTRWGASGPVWSPSSTTAIHRWDISERDRTVYRSSGEIPGHLLNQFSMSEHRGVLRVASTLEEDGSSSRVTVLDERSGRLQAIGQVGELGRGERIYAVRFIEDAGFVVTFRQTDPLYAIDLSDPARPVKRGELKIPGYSAYLHPAGDDLLIGVGRDGTESGGVLGVQISLFDVSDLDHPRRLHAQALGSETRSEVETDHHAFLWWPKTQLAVVPFLGFSDAGAFSGGAAGFRLRREGIATAGTLTHPSSPSQSGIERTLVVRDRLVSLSQDGLMVGRTDTLGPGAWLALGASAG